MDIKKPPKSSSARDPEVKTFTDALEKILSASGPTVPATRKELKETAEKLSLALETPGETVQRVAYYVSSVSHPTVSWVCLGSSSGLSHCR